MKLNRIVVGVDFSENSRVAARWAAVHLAAGAEVILAHVIPTPGKSPLGRDPLLGKEETLATLREGAEKRLRDLSAGLGTGRRWLEVREAPSVREGIAAIRAEYQADIVVVGAHGERRGLSALLGQTAQHVVRGSDVPVLVVNTPAERGVKRILVPVDDPHMARPALRVAADIAAQIGAEVSMIHVVAAGVMSHVLADRTESLAEFHGAAADREGRPGDDRWAPLAAEVGLGPQHAATEFVFGDPVVEIVDASARHDADLIVMGRADAGGFRRAVIGSVTDGVLRQARCSVLVVPEPTDELREPS